MYFKHETIQKKQNQHRNKTHHQKRQQLHLQKQKIYMYDELFRITTKIIRE